MIIGGIARCCNRVCACFVIFIPVLRMIEYVVIDPQQPALIPEEEDRHVNDGYCDGCDVIIATGSSVSSAS